AMNAFARIHQLICFAFFFYCLSDLMNELKKTATSLQLEYDLQNVTLPHLVSCSPVSMISNMTIAQFSKGFKIWAKADRMATIRFNATYGFRIKKHFCIVFNTAYLSINWTIVHALNLPVNELSIGFIQSDPSELLQQ